MAQSIKLGNDTYLDASGISGIKGEIYSSSGIDLNNLKTAKDAGMYYVSNGVPHSPTDYALLIVATKNVNGAYCFQLMWGGNHVYTRSYFQSVGSWSHWFRYDGTDMGS